MMFTRAYFLFKAARPTQWLKNVVVYTAILFNGKLFEPELFINYTIAFVLFCTISSASYIFNDIVDAPYDRKHPIKKNRPIASGELPIADATFTLFILVILAITVGLYVRISLGILIFVFFSLHVAYTLYLKKQTLLDIFSISASFMIRLFAGEFITGFHVPIWLWLTVFFFSLFIASVKRHSEYINEGTNTRPVLKDYTEQLLFFLVNAFSVMTVFSYSFYTFLEKPPHIRTSMSEFFSPLFRTDEPRKWFMLTIPFVVFGIARYAQLLYEHREGEAPEKVITRDKVLIATVLLWGLSLLSLIYVL